MAAFSRSQLLAAAGSLVLAAAWLGPLPAWSRHSFAAHMLMHMAVVLASGAAPVVASVVEFVVVWAWHAPALHHAARASTAVLLLEQGSFLVVGLALWLSAFGGDAPRWRERAAAGIGGLLMTSMHMTLLGVLLALASRPLYVHGMHGAMLPVGLTPVQDQHLGGVLMLVFGGSAYLAGALWLLAGLLRERAGTVADG